MTTPNMEQHANGSVLSLIPTALLFLLCSAQAQETLEEKTKRLQWFKDAKLGIFVHWSSSRRTTRRIRL